MISRRQLLAATGSTVLATTVPGLAACGNTAGPASKNSFIGNDSSGSSETVKLAWGPGASWGFIYAPVSQVFKRFGLAIDMTEGLNGAAMLTFLGSGAINTATMAPSANVVANSIGLNLKIVYADAATWLLGLYARPGSGMTEDPSTWIGKRIGVAQNSQGDYGLRWSLQRAGLSWKDLDSLYLSPTAAIAAYQRGEIDGYYAWDIWGSRLKQYGAQLVQKAANTGFLSSSIWCINEEYLESHRDEAIQFVAALNQANVELKQLMRHGGPRLREALNAIGDANGISPQQAHRLLKAQPPVGLDALLSPQFPLSFTNRASGLAAQIRQQGSIAYEAGAIEQPLTTPENILAPISLLKKAAESNPKDLGDN